MKKRTSHFDLTAWRQNCGLTQEAAARALGVSVTQLWRAEKQKETSTLLFWACLGYQNFLKAKP